MVGQGRWLINQVGVGVELPSGTLPLKICDPQLALKFAQLAAQIADFADKLGAGQPHAGRQQNQRK
jgi:hypothetical protein